MPRDSERAENERTFIWLLFFMEGMRFEELGLRTVEWCPIVLARRNLGYSG